MVRVMEVVRWIKGFFKDAEKAVLSSRGYLKRFGQSEHASQLKRRGHLNRRDQLAQT